MIDRPERLLSVIGRQDDDYLLPVDHPSVSLTLQVLCGLQPGAILSQAHALNAIHHDTIFHPPTQAGPTAAGMRPLSAPRSLAVGTDFCYNQAGVAREGVSSEMSISSWQRDVALDLHTPARVPCAFQQQCRAQKARHCGTVRGARHDSTDSTAVALSRCRRMTRRPCMAIPLPRQGTREFNEQK